MQQSKMIYPNPNSCLVFITIWLVDHDFLSFSPNMSLNCKCVYIQSLLPIQINQSIRMFDIQMLWLVTCLAVILLGVDIGLGVGVAVAIFSVILRTQRPKCGIMGHIPNTDIYRDLSYYRAVCVSLLAQKFLSFKEMEYWEREVSAVLVFKLIGFFGSALKIVMVEYINCHKLRPVIG